jgi:hypothetical protein
MLQLVSKINLGRGYIAENQTKDISTLSVAKDVFIMHDSSN